jgi:cytoskeletal protein RodZ
MAKPKSKLERKSLIPLSILAIIVALLTVVTMVAVAHAQSQELSRIEKAKAAEMSNVPSQKEEAVVEPQNKPEEKPVEKKEEPKPEPPKVDPNGCEAKGMWWRADNYECIPKPQPVAAQSRAAAAPATSGGSGSGSCAAEIAKYGWNQSVALAVARAESGLDPGNLNNNPATGDYSVGCFQINIYGANAASRPSEAALKNAATNVAFAYKIYVGNGHSFLGQWGVCRYKVSCY